MSITPDVKEKLIKDYATKEGDTGSLEKRHDTLQPSVSSGERGARQPVIRDYYGRLILDRVTLPLDSRDTPDPRRWIARRE